MAFAISLMLDPRSSDIVERQWRRLADIGVSRSMLELRYPPHATLAVCDRLDRDAAIPSLARTFEQVAPIDFSLIRIETFAPGSGVLYVSVAPSSELRALQAEVVDAIGGACRPHYLPGHWTPHCTLATGVADQALDDAKRVLENDWRPLAGQFVGARLVEFAPVIPIADWSFRPDAQSIRTP